jgi:hypothetical protein
VPLLFPQGPEDVSIGDWAGLAFVSPLRDQRTERIPAAPPQVVVLVRGTVRRERETRRSRRMGRAITDEELRLPINDREGANPRLCVMGVWWGRVGSPVAGRCRRAPVSAKPCRPVKGKGMGQTRARARSVRQQHCNSSICCYRTPRNDGHRPTYTTRPP